MKHSSRKSLRFALVGGIAAFIGCNAQAAVTLFVNAAATGSDNGTTWPNAYTSLQSAITAALAATPGPSVSNVFTIKVAQGTYKPTTGTTRTATFTLHPYVNILGGYAGSGGNPDDRKVDTYVTVLSGEIGNTGDVTDNSFNVVTASDDAIEFDNCRLDGVTITAGNGNHGFSEPGPTLEGRGITILTGASPRINNCTVTDNVGGNFSYGAGVHVDGTETNSVSSSPVFTLCHIKNNGASEYGGGMVVRLGGTTKIIDTVFDGNAAPNGGGLAVKNTSHGDVINCLFINNSAAGGNAWGGGMSVDRSGSATITNCTFSANSADKGGGYAQSLIEDPGTPDTTMRNCIFWGNTVTSSDKSIYVDSGDPGVLTVDHSDVEGGLPAGATNGGGNYTTDPNFADVGSGDYRLRCPSDAINHGNTSIPQDTYDVDNDSVTTGGGGEATPDLDVSDRVVDSVPDMGAYEATSLSVCAGDVNNNCTVNIDDLLAVIAQWGPCSSPPCSADVSPASPCATGNGSVDIDDLLLVINQWGDCHCSDTENTTGAYPATTVNECMDAATENFEPFSEDWTNYVNGCLEYLCRHQLIECDG